MSKRISIFLLSALNTILYVQQGLAEDLTSKCMLGIPNYNRPLIQGDTNKMPVTIISDNVVGNYPDNMLFSGNVEVSQGNSHLQADKVLLHQKNLDGTKKLIRTVNALGNVYYNDNHVILKGQKALVNLNTKDTDVWKGDYQMVEHQGRGKADLVKQRNENRYIILENGSFTSCLPGSNTWSIMGSKVIHDREEQIAKIWNARFQLGKVPIFYSPYLQLPVGDKRRSGFLIPNVKYSITNHFECYLPYYWNIGPSIDVTITPHYMHRRRNIMWENDLRYLTKAGMGIAEFYYLPLGKVFKEKDSITSDLHRWMCHWKHSGIMEQRWHFNINYTRMSDPYYFKDFSSSYSHSSDGYATQMFSISYVMQNFNATISTRQFQVFNGLTDSVYGSEPQLDINWNQNDIKPFDMRVYGQAVHFINTNSNMPKATRIHIEPSINMLLSNEWSSLNTEAKLMTTFYQQRNLESFNAVNNTNLKESVSRAMPQFKVDGKLIFERDIQLANSYIQTLEPRVQYLYVPYRDQSKINNYDSSLLQSDYTGLFRDRTYSGLDRFPSENKVTAGITSRVFDDKSIERFNVSVSQIYYFSESRTGDSNFNWKNDNKTGFLALTGDTYWRITDHFGLRDNIQYDTRLDNLATSAASVEYYLDKDHMMRLTYRYASLEYIQAILLGHDITERYNHGISQVGGEASWSLADRWEIVGTCYFDINARKSANQKLWLQYNSCCYAIRVEYKRKFNEWNVNSNQNKYDNVIGFNIELRGLNSNYDVSTQQMLHSNILPVL